MRDPKDVFQEAYDEIRDENPKIDEGMAGVLAMDRMREHYADLADYQRMLAKEEGSV